MRRPPRRGCRQGADHEGHPRRTRPRHRYRHHHSQGVSSMMTTTTPFIAGWRVSETKGQVFGLVVRSRGLAGNLAAGLRSIVGGEIHEYTELLEDTRRQAVDRMVQNATLMGANAILSMRFDSSEIGQTMSEIVAYGTGIVAIALRRSRYRSEQAVRISAPAGTGGGEDGAMEPRFQRTEEAIIDP